MRRIFIVEDGIEREIEFAELQKDDKFKMFDDENGLVVNGKGRSIFIAASEVYVKNGLETIDVY